MVTSLRPEYECFDFCLEGRGMSIVAKTIRSVSEALQHTRVPDDGPCGTPNLGLIPYFLVETSLSFIMGYSDCARYPVLVCSVHVPCFGRSERAETRWIDRPSLPRVL